METKSAYLALKLKNEIIFCIIHFHEVQPLCNAFAMDKIVGACVGIENYVLLSRERETKLHSLLLRHSLFNLLLQFFLSSRVHISFIARASLQTYTHTSLGAFIL